MNIPYNIDVYDNLINSGLQSKLWDYVRVQEWHQKWVPAEHAVTRYRPVNGLDWFVAKGMHMGSSMHRCALASDEDSLKENHMPIYLLWKELNRSLNNQYTLTGLPEGMWDKDIEVPIPKDPNLSTGWRAYINASHNTQVIGNGYIHRDSSLLDREDLVTMLYVVNPEWYPSWGAEVRYYPEDPEGVAGDHQQFNTGNNQQKRGFNIGWLDCGRIVSPVPGRLTVYDGRCLHATSASNNNDIETPLIKIAFRAQRISGTK